jgi:chorismate-pyruvate lyase
VRRTFRNHEIPVLTRDHRAAPPDTIADLYSGFGQCLVAARCVAPADLPPEARRLLVHGRGLTVTLEAEYGDALGLEVVQSVLVERCLKRHVHLTLRRSDVTVGEAVCHIHLQHFPPAAVQLILTGTMPLGRILASYQVVTAWEPRAFVEVAADGGLEDGHSPGTITRHGRHIVLRGVNGDIVAEAFELLVPRGSRAVLPSLFSGASERSLGVDG